ncbi:hypothetical protein D3C73_732530 [compost metagenome]
MNGGRRHEPGNGRLQRRRSRLRRDLRGNQCTRRGFLFDIFRSAKAHHLPDQMIRDRRYAACGHALRLWDFRLCQGWHRSSRDRLTIDRLFDDPLHGCLDRLRNGNSRRGWCECLADAALEISHLGTCICMMWSRLARGHGDGDWLARLCWSRALSMTGLLDGNDVLLGRAAAGRAGKAHIGRQYESALPCRKLFRIQLDRRYRLRQRQRLLRVIGGHELLFVTPIGVFDWGNVFAGRRKMHVRETIKQRDHTGPC